MAKLTTQEKAWVKKLQAVLTECPSIRLGFFTVGDNFISIYDKTVDSEIDELQSQNGGMEFCGAVEELDADFGRIIFPSNVHSTCG